MGSISNLELTGGNAIDGTGNVLNNTITGNTADNTLIGLEGDDRLDGGSGADSLIGNTGDDTYVVDNVADVVTEVDGEGNDTVFEFTGEGQDHVEASISGRQDFKQQIQTMIKRRVNAGQASRPCRDTSIISSNH